MEDYKNINELAKNPKVREILRKIIDKINRNKKYKQNSIEMAEEIKKKLAEILAQQDKVVKNDINNDK